MKKAKDRVTKKKIKNITFGVTDALMNVVLYCVFIGGSSIGKTGPAGVHQTFDEADELIGAVNAKKIRKALYNLKQKGFINTFKEEMNLPVITKAGLRRINQEFPAYEEVRKWDGMLYIVNYDIPIKQNSKRDILRDNLKLLKTANLQKSVYLTPYNPREIIKRLVEEHSIEGSIFISKLDPKDAFGEVDIKDLLWEMHGLAEVNQSYKIFISRYKRIGNLDAKPKKTEIAFEYMSILESDPQLPFDLLLEEYLGDEAYLLYKRILQS